MIKNITLARLVRDDLILNLDENDRIVAIEILDVSANIAQPDTFEYVDITHTRYDEKIEADTTN